MPNALHKFTTPLAVPIILANPFEKTAHRSRIIHQR
jgi:hypothetical protein